MSSLLLRSTIAATRRQGSPFGRNLFLTQQHQQQQHRSFDDMVIDPQAMSKQKKDPKQKKSAKPSYRFVDRTRIRVSGGYGGKGCLSMQRLMQRYKKKPDGGHGGDGGSVVLVADPNEQSLRRSHPHAQAEKGANGGSSDKTGRNGKNLILRVPCGVVVKRVIDHDEVWDEATKTVTKLVTDDDDESYFDMEEGEGGLEYEQVDYSQYEEEVYYSEDEEDAEQEDRELVVLADLDEPGTHVLVAKGKLVVWASFYSLKVLTSSLSLSGGRGGSGTCLYASAHGPLPADHILAHFATPKPGEVAFLELELKMIADLGLVGFPNAGKSVSDILYLC
jgi:GTP-binding protein